MDKVTMEVYRVEVEATNGNTYGVFTADKYFYTEEQQKLVEEACDHFLMSSSSYSMPEPSEDGIDLYLHHNHICGCPTAELMLEWVPVVYLHKFIEAGFKINKYRITTSATCVGKHQVIWYRVDQELIQTLTVEQLVDISYEEIFGLERMV